MASGVLFNNAIFGQTTGSGYKLFFYQTQTTTDVTVYSDDLVTAHTQPVVANSDGEFAAIYINPSSGDLKVVLKDSLDVTLYTVDPYPVDNLASLTSTVTTNTANITAIDGRLTTAESEIDTLQTESADYETRITTNTTNIATLTANSLTSLAATLTVPGTIAFPTNSGGNNLIFKWEEISVGPDTTATLTWDTAFPNAFLSAMTSFKTSIDNQNDASANWQNGTTTQITIQNTAGATETIAVWALGY